jgi:hypothetical protein
MVYIQHPEEAENINFTTHLEWLLPSGHWGTATRTDPSSAHVMIVRLIVLFKDTIWNGNIVKIWASRDFMKGKQIRIWMEFIVAWRVYSSRITVVRLTKTKEIL